MTERRSELTDSDERNTEATSESSTMATEFSGRAVAKRFGFDLE